MSEPKTALALALEAARQSQQQLREEKGKDSQMGGDAHPAEQLGSFAEKRESPEPAPKAQVPKRKKLGLFKKEAPAAEAPHSDPEKSDPQMEQGFQWTAPFTPPDRSRLPPQYGGSLQQGHFRRRGNRQQT